ncbi:MAG: ribosome-associated translation inhibitor RaiA [Chloroflexota bacterium]|nr:ribosome-associated translation inhibitor RaiA [Chloroflexota bacterium]
MNIEIQGRNLRITEKLEEHAKRKLGRLDRYLPNIANVYVEIERERTRQNKDVVSVQITVRHNRGAILRAEERGTEEDLPSTLNHAVDNMYRRIERFKGKSAPKGRERFVERYGATDEELEEAEEIPDAEISVLKPVVVADEYAPEVARHKQVVLTPMTEHDAIEQMELLGHTFFIFFNQASQSVNVLYRRASGDYGVLVPVVDGA